MKLMKRPSGKKADARSRIIRIVALLCALLIALSAAAMALYSAH